MGWLLLPINLPYDANPGGWNFRKGQEPSGALLFNKSQKKYVSWPAFANEQGFSEPVSRDESEANYLKSWHWIYRWIAAARSNEDWRRTMWDMSRVRLRDLSRLKIDVQKRQTTLGEVFTSEKAMAIILRWHIRYPKHIAKGEAGKYLTRIVNRALSRDVPDGWPSDPKNWTDDHEKELIRSALDVAKSLRHWQTIKTVSEWPSWKDGRNPREFKLAEGVSPLSERRNSFQLYEHDLPPRPWQDTGEYVLV